MRGDEFVVVVEVVGGLATGRELEEDEAAGPFTDGGGVVDMVMGLRGEPGEPAWGVCFVPGCQGNEFEFIFEGEWFYGTL